MSGPSTIVKVEVNERAYLDGQEPCTVKFVGTIWSVSHPYAANKKVEHKRDGSSAYAKAQHKKDAVWIGIAFDRPIGHHGGKVNGIRYFNCKPKHGVFVRPHRLTPMKSDSSGPSSIPKGAPPRLGIKKKRAPLPRVATVQSKAAPVSESPGRKTFSPRKWLSKPPRVAGLASTPSRGGVKSRLNQAPVQNVSLYLSQTNTSPTKKRGGVPRCAQVPKGKKKEKPPSKFIHEVQPRGAGTSRLDVDSDDEEEQIPKKKGKGKGRKSPRKVSPAVSRPESPSHEFEKDATEDDDDEVPSPTREAWSNDAPPTLSETDEDEDENIDRLNQSGFGSGYVSLVEEEDEENLIENDAKLLDQMLDTLEEAIEAADSGDTRLTPVSFEESDIASPSVVPSKIEDLAKRREAERRAREEKIQEDALRRRSSMQSTEPPKTPTVYDTALAAQTAIIEEQSVEITKVLADLENDTEDLHRETLEPDPVVVSNAVSALSVAIIQGAEVVSDVTMVRNEMALVHANDVGNIIPKIIAAKAAASSARIDVENAIAALEKVDVNGDSASIIATAKATVKRFEKAESAAALTLNEAEQTIRSETDISEPEVTTNEAKTTSNAVVEEVPVNSVDGEGKFNTEEEAQAIKAEDEAKAKAEEEARIKAEEEAKAKAAEEARIKAEEEAKAKTKEEARIKAEEEAKAKAEEEAKAAKIQAEKDAAAFLAAEFPIDTPVKLHSLNNNKKLNGSMGVVVKHIPAKNRAGVKLDNGNTLSLKVANLRKLTEEDISLTDETIVASEPEKSHVLETVGLAAAATAATVALPDVLSPEVGVTSPVAPVTKEPVAAEEAPAASEGTAEVASSVEAEATIKTVPEPVESGTAEAIVTQAIEVPVELAAPLGAEEIVKAISSETEVAVESISDPVEAAHEDDIAAQASKLNAEEVAPDTPEKIVEAVSSAVEANDPEPVEVADEVSAMNAVEVATEDIAPETSGEVVQVATVTDSEAHPENVTEPVAPKQVELTSEDSATETYVESAVELVQHMSGDDPKDNIAEDVVEEMPSPVGRAVEEATVVDAQIEDTVVESADAATKAEIVVENISESVEAVDEASTAVKASAIPAEAAAPEFIAENDVVPSESETVVANAPKPVESETVTSETIAESATEVVVPVSEGEAAHSTEISTNETATEPLEDIPNTVLSEVEAVSDSVAEPVQPTAIEVVEEEMNTSDKLFDDAVDATEADVVGVAIEEAAEEMLVLAVAEERIADNIIDEIQDEELKEIVVLDTDAEEKKGVIVEPEPDSMYAEETVIPVFTENMNTEELAVMMESLGESEAAAIIVDQNLDASDLLQMDVNELQEELNISLDDTQKIIEHVDLSEKDPEDEVLTKNFNPAGPYHLEWDCETLCTWLDQSGIALEIIDMIHTNNLDAEDLVELEEDEIRSWVSVGRRGSIDGALDDVQKLMLLVHGITPSSVNVLPALSEEEEDISAEDIADATPDFDLEWDSATLTSWMTIMGLDNFVETIAEHDLDAMDLYHLELEEMVEAFNVSPDDEKALENVQDLYDLVHEEVAEEKDLDMSIEPPPKMQSKWRENIVTSWNNDQLCMWLKEMGATDVSRVINEQVSGAQIVQLGRDELQHILVDLDVSKLDNIHNALRKQARPAFRPDFSADDIVEWLSQIGESRWKTTVQTNEYDGQDLLEMSISELSSIFGESAEDLKAAMIWKAAPTAV